MNRNFVVNVPAGTYHVGDPCYTFPNELWDSLLDSSDYFDRPCGTVNGHTVYAAATSYGDGTYIGSDMKHYSVESGLIGLVPAALGERDPWLYRTVTFDHDFKFVYRDGIFIIDDITIDTRPYDDYNV